MKFTPKKYSDDEIAKRTARIRAVQQLGADAMAKKADSRRRLLDEKRDRQKAAVKAAAALGIFIPVQDFE